MQDIQLIRSTLRMPFTKFPVLTPVVKLNAGVVMISPGSQLTEKQLSDAGPITDLVAPNLMHSAGIPKAQSCFPKASVWGVPGLDKHRPSIRWTGRLTGDSWPHNEELTLLEVAGMPKLREVVFLHRASKTLIVTDLAFHMVQTEGLGTWLMTHAFGTYGRFAVSRLFKRIVKDRTAFRESMNKILMNDFDNIIVSHGEVLKGGAQQALIQAMSARGLVL